MRISVLTPCRNAEKYIDEAIASVLSQNYENFEHIVIDGGSHDRTVDILKKYPHLTWLSEPDKGQSDAMNKGFNLSKGDIIVYLNADDYFLPHAFDVVMRQFEKGAKFVVGKVAILHEDGSRQINDPKTEMKDMLKWWERNAFCCNPVGYFYHREVQKRIGGFKENNHYTMDYEFLLESALRFELTKIDATLGVHRRSKGTKTYESIANFNHVLHFNCANQFLQHFKEDYQRAYIASRDRHIKRVMEDKYIVTAIDNLKKSHYRDAVYALTKLFLYSPVRIFYRFGRFILKHTLVDITLNKRTNSKKEFP